MIILYQAYAAGFWTNLYRTPQVAANVIRRHCPEARQCIVYDGPFEEHNVDAALSADISEQLVFFHPTSIYLAGKVSDLAQKASSNDY